MKFWHQKKDENDEPDEALWRAWDEAEPVELVPKPHRHMFYDAAADALTLYTATDYAGTPKTFSDPLGGILIDVVDGVIVSVEILAVSQGLFAALLPQVYGGTLTSFEFGTDEPRRTSVESK